jgi:phage shock protein PspC (stress-responsive transcriptional regulator)
MAPEMFLGVGIIWGLILFWLARQWRWEASFARVLWVLLMVLWALGGVVSWCAATSAGSCSSRSQ